jgi:molecular chaperone DnaK
MQREAEEHKADDEKRKKAVDARNTLDGLIYSLEKTLKESGDKVSADAKKEVEDALVEARKHLSSNDAEVLVKATEDLTKASNKMAEQMYKNAQASGAQSGAQAGANGSAGESEAKSEKKKDDDVIDADFKEV